MAAKRGGSNAINGETYVHLGTLFLLKVSLLFLNILCPIDINDSIISIDNGLANESQISAREEA